MTLSQQGTQGYDRIGVLSRLKKGLLLCTIPVKIFAIDKDLVPYKGRSTWKQYMPKSQYVEV